MNDRESLTRREFIVYSAGCALAASSAAGTVLAADAAATPAAPPIPTPRAPARPGAHVTAHTWTLPEKQSFQVIENAWIPMKDGINLGVRLWIPDSAAQEPVAVVWEYLPYRKRDLERWRDDGWANAFVPYGFAFARVDIRGSGDSQGVLLGEYLQQEQDDAVQVIAWLARQSWCNGAVGMRGISWGGFSSLQAAALAPPALKAIMPQCASDNRYTDDAHYVGGSLALDNFDWGAEFKNVLVGAPDPAIVGPSWREQWLKRLHATPPILAQWLRHQRYDAFWQHGSIATHFAAIKCPVYAVGGQIDSYRDFLPRLLEHLNVPRKGLMGPWGHRYPQLADPGPGLDWVTEEVRWWTRWLLNIDTGIMQEPMFRAYMEESTAAQVWPRDTPGRWISEATWPAPEITAQTWYLNADGLGATPKPGPPMTCHSQETLGLTKREWFPWDMSIDLPPDQTPDDARSLTFDTEPLTRDLEILGNPVLRVRVSADQPVAKLAVRLNEVLPDDTSWSVSYGILNLTHRESHSEPTALVPGHSYDVDVPCYFTAHRFSKGSRIRIALSESLWPLVWPSPRAVTLQIATGASHVTLPVRPMEAVADTLPIEILRGRVAAKVKNDPDLSSKYAITQTGPDAAGRVTLDKRLRDLPETLSTGTVVSGGSDWHMAIREGDPNSGVWRLEWTSHLERGEWNTTTRSRLQLTSTPTTFHLKESITALEAGRVVFDKTWEHDIPRDLM